jgi:hypothetical protein
MKYCGYWWSDLSIKIVKIDGVKYALHGWNGYAFTDCWECIDSFTPINSLSYTLTPVYRHMQENIDVDILEENSAEWEYAMEIVSYNVVHN